MCLVAQKGRALPNGRATAPLDFVSELLRHHTSVPSHLILDTGVLVASDEILASIKPSL
jgi:hypothetical protein